MLTALLEGELDERHEVVQRLLFRRASGEPVREVERTEIEKRRSVRKKDRERPVFFSDGAQAIAVAHHFCVVQHYPKLARLLMWLKSGSISRNFFRIRLMKLRILARYPSGPRPRQNLCRGRDRRSRGSRRSVCLPGLQVTISNSVNVRLTGPQCPPCVNRSYREFRLGSAGRPSPSRNQLQPL